MPSLKLSKKEVEEILTDWAKRRLGAVRSFSLCMTADKEAHMVWEENVVKVANEKSLPSPNLIEDVKIDLGREAL